MTCRELKTLQAERDEPVRPSAQGCQECLAEGARWVHLRLCMTCGHVGCCDSSPGRHATHHFHATRHPVVKSFEPGESWAWCYRHEEAADAIPAFPSESPVSHYGAPGARGEG